jgi:CRP-like cAMP-binding protein
VIPISGPTRNRILDTLPPEERRALEPHLKDASFKPGEIIYRPGERLSHIYFPTTCVFSVVMLMQDGAGVEIDTTGREGLTGSLQVLLSSDSAQSQTFCQVPGDAKRMPLDAFKKCLAGGEKLRSLTERYARSSVTLMGQSIACNRLHTLNERCARWLLLTHDRVGSDQFKLTQEFLATMLGVHRPAVSVAAGALQQAGFIRYRRGFVTVVDAEGLESASCECYKVAMGQINDA